MKPEAEPPVIGLLLFGTRGGTSDMARNTDRRTQDNFAVCRRFRLWVRRVAASGAGLGGYELRRRQFDLVSFLVQQGAEAKP